MAKYLDPKADLTFKKVFGEHKDLMISFLNALLPLKKGEEVKEIEYLQPELVPDSPLKKDTIVDVRIDRQTGAFVYCGDADDMDTGVYETGAAQCYQGLLAADR